MRFEFRSGERFSVAPKGRRPPRSRRTVSDNVSERHDERTEWLSGATADLRLEQVAMKKGFQVAAGLAT